MLAAFDELRSTLAHYLAERQPRPSRPRPRALLLPWRVADRLKAIAWWERTSFKDLIRRGAEELVRRRPGLGWGGERVPPGSVRGRITSRRRSHVAGRGAAAGGPDDAHAARDVVPNLRTMHEMDDTTRASCPDHARLFAIATGQAGYFTTAQARGFRLGSSAAQPSCKERPLRPCRSRRVGLRDYPSSPREELLAAWLSLAPSCPHESALEVFGSRTSSPTDPPVRPAEPTKLSRRPGVALHTTTRPLDGSSVVGRDGMRLTAPGRTIADVAAAGVAPSRSHALSGRPSTVA